MKISVLLIIIMALMYESLPTQNQQTDHWHLRNREFKDQLDTLHKGSIVFLGNSITEGFDLEHFFPVSNPINRGIKGDHIDGLIDRLELSVIKLQPSQLFILIGINDIGAGKSDSTVLANYEELLDSLTGELPETEIYVQSILPTRPEWSNCPKEKIIRLNKEIENYVRLRGLNWIDLYSEFVDPEGYLNPVYSSDGLHLNANGYILWQKILNKFGVK